VDRDIRKGKKKNRSEGLPFLWNGRCKREKQEGRGGTGSFLSQKAVKCKKKKVHGEIWRSMLMFAGAGGPSFYLVFECSGDKTPSHAK